MKNQKMKKPLIKALVLLAVCASLFSCFVISSSADITAIENPTIISGTHFVAPLYGQYTMNCYGRFLVEAEATIFTRILVEPVYVGGTFTSMRVVYFTPDGTSFNAGMVLSDGIYNFIEGWDLIIAESLLVPSSEHFVPCFQMGQSYHIISVPRVTESIGEGLVSENFLFVDASRNYDIVRFNKLNIVENDVIGGWEIRYDSNLIINDLMTQPYQGNLYFTCLNDSWCSDANNQRIVNEYIVPVVRSSISYDEGYGEGYYDGYNDGLFDGEEETKDYWYWEGYYDGVNSVEDPEGNRQEIYDEGYANGKLDGDAEGYLRGLQEGKELGYADGKLDGENSQQSPLIGSNLLGDALDVPFEALNSFTIYVSPSGFEVTLGLVLGGCITLTLLLAFLKMFAGG